MLGVWQTAVNQNMISTFGLFMLNKTVLSASWEQGHLINKLRLERWVNAQVKNLCIRSQRKTGQVQSAGP